MTQTKQLSNGIRVCVVEVPVKTKKIRIIHSQLRVTHNWFGRTVFERYDLPEGAWRLIGTTVASQLTPAQWQESGITPQDLEDMNADPTVSVILISKQVK